MENTTSTKKQNTTVSTTKTCTRCHGSGSYSYNLKDGTVCYGCGGSGKVACAPKGQKKIKPTVNHINKAKPGDIIEIRCVLYRVEEIRWIAYEAPKKMMDLDANQRVKMIRLVDGKTFNIKRAIIGKDGYAVHTPEHLIGEIYISE